MEINVDELKKQYKIPTEEEFDEYRKKAILDATFNKAPVPEDEREKIVIVGGQTGAGKSRLVSLAINELGDDAVVVDFDALRALNPSYEVVAHKYPEITHLILYEDTERVKNELLDYLIENRYNVIYEGAMRNTQGFIDFARKFYASGYEIDLKIMSVPELESYGSTLTRYCAALITDDVIARWVEKYAHDESCEGVIRTVEEFQRQGLVDDIKVYIRTDELPREIYSTEGRQYETPTLAILDGRDIQRAQAIEAFSSKFKIVKGILEERQPELLPRLDVWQEMYYRETAKFVEDSSEKSINE